MTSRQGRRRLQLTVACAAAVLVPGCAAARDVVSPRARPDGAIVRGFPLELAFGEEPPSAGEPPGPQVVIPELPDLPTPGVGAPLSDVEIFGADDLFIPRSDPPASEAPGECPEPGPGAVAERPITTDVREPVVPGAYTFRQGGTIEYVGLFTTTPAKVGRRTISKVQTTSGVTTFEVEAAMGRRRQIQEIRVVPGDGIFLVGMRTSVDGQEQRFQPTLPVEILPLPVAEHTPVNGVGADPRTGETVVVQGAVTRKERVLGCDEVVDGWLVEATWTFRRGAEVRPFDYDYVVATQHGGMVVGDHLVATESYGGLVVKLDVTAALGSISPRSAAP